MTEFDQAVTGTVSPSNKKPKLNSRNTMDDITATCPAMSSNLAGTNIAPQETNVASDATASKDNRATPQVTVHEPGLVQIHAALRISEQLELAMRILEVRHVDKGDDGFWEKNQDGTVGLNSSKTRGRIYRAIDEFSCVELLRRLFTKEGRKVHELACTWDPQMPSYRPCAHALLLYYCKNRGILEHQDKGLNDGSSDQPVISFNLGTTVDFTARHTKNEPKRTIRLESGDALLFGGPCRMIFHSVEKIHSGTSPLVEHDLEDVRLNLTLRYAPEILGKEEAYKYFKPMRGAAATKEQMEGTKKQS